MDTTQSYCTRCEQTKPISAFSLGASGKPRPHCKPCRATAVREARIADPEKFKAADRERYWRDPEKRRTELRRRWREEPGKKEKHYAYLKAHPEYKERYAQKLREEAITRYGGCCAQCGETRLPFLWLSHLDNDGAARRRAIPGANGGNAYYRKLRGLNYPPGLQVLCANCTWRQERSRRQNKSAAQARHNEKLRRKMFDHYGNVCACCGESDLAVLTIDHINNDGAAHRKAIRESIGVSFYRAMIAQEFPSGLQTLCWNCNTAKASVGICPHCTDQSSSS